MAKTMPPTRARAIISTSMIKPSAPAPSSPIRVLKKVGFQDHHKYSSQYHGHQMSRVLVQDPGGDIQDLSDVQIGDQEANQPQADHDP